MKNIDKKFILIGLSYLLIGMLHGLYMAYVGNYLYSIMHAHLLLIGGFLMMIFGILHYTLPKLRNDALSTLHFWLTNIGAPAFFIGITLAVSGITPWVAHAGATLTIISLVIFMIMAARMETE